MTKHLKHIVEADKRLEGVKSSTTTDGDVGPLARDDDKDKRFIAQHKVQKHLDRVGNKKAPYKADTASNTDADHRNDAESKKAYKAGNDVKESLAGVALGTLVGSGVGTYVGNKLMSTYFNHKDKKAAEARKKKDSAERAHGAGTAAVKNALFKGNNRTLKKEEVEEIDELSKNTLMSYRSKRLNQIDKMSKDVKSSVKSANVDPDKVRKHLVGIKTAHKKIKEETIEEAKSKDGYQLWPGQKKKKFFNGPKDKDGKTETQKWAEKRAAERAAKAVKEETLDEISRNTLLNYRTKASKSHDDAKWRIGSEPHWGNFRKDAKTMDKREAGIKKADKKLTKEEVEIEEGRVGPSSGNRSGAGLSFGVSKDYTKEPGQNQRLRSQFAPKKSFKDIIKDRVAKLAKEEVETVEEGKDVPYNHGRSKATNMDTPVASRVDGSGTYYKLARGYGGKSTHHVVYTKGGQTIQSKTEKSALKKLDKVKEEVETVEEGNKANKLKKKDWLDPKKREKSKFKSDFDPRDALKKR